MNFNRCKRFAIDSKTVRMKLDTQHKICFTMSQKISTRNIFNQTKWQKSRFEQKKKAKKPTWSALNLRWKQGKLTHWLFFKFVAKFTSGILVIENVFKIMKRKRKEKTSKCIKFSVFRSRAKIHTQTKLKTVNNIYCAQAHTWNKIQFSKITDNW